MSGGGTGQKLTTATIIVAGVAALVATVLSAISILLQAKNYRKPLLQRYVVRILLMVPIYSFSSWTSMMSTTAAQFVDPIRDIYEAFTIYTFFQLLINYLGGERSLIIMTHGREPVSHLWPLNHVFRGVDISDPHTFLSIKRGILQYAWIKPILSIAAIIMKATGTYQEGYVGVTSGYFWSGIIYNVSVTVSLYFLGLFWVCMHQDLLPFRPVPKFLCIKLIIFASYWQGFALSILVWLGAIPDNVEGYTPDNLAAAIQDALICLEMPVFAIAHWYAFSWQDFADRNILSARMPVRFAFRDAFGPVDLIQDTKETFKGDQYSYRIFDSNDKIIAHEESRARLGRLKEGMRYQRGGQAKYWIPTPGQVDRKAAKDLNERDPLLAGPASGPSRPYNYANGTFHDDLEHDDPTIDPEEDKLYDKAKQLEYGDWNYPVITAHEPLRERFMSASSNAWYQSVPTTPSPGESSSTQARQLGDGTRQANAGPETVKPKSKKKQKQKQKQTEPPQGQHQQLHRQPADPDGHRQSKSEQTPLADPSTSPRNHEARGKQQEGSGGSPTSRSKPEASHERSRTRSPWDDDEEVGEGQVTSPGDLIGGHEDEFRNPWGGGGG